MVLGSLGVLKVVCISLACGRVEYKVNQMLDKYKPRKTKSILNPKRWW